MAPAFKTPRQLRSRALVSDFWHKPNIVTEPGIGNQVHRDGYNVLYGDYSVSWYGDAEQRIMYWDTVSGGLYHEGLASTKAYNQGLGNADPWLRMSPQIWHILDNQANMDTEVGNPRAYPNDWYNYAPYNPGGPELPGQ